MSTVYDIGTIDDLCVLLKYMHICSKMKVVFTLAPCIEHTHLYFAIPYGDKPNQYEINLLFDSGLCLYDLVRFIHINKITEPEIINEIFGCTEKGLIFLIRRGMSKLFINLFISLNRCDDIYLIESIRSNNAELFEFLLQKFYKKNDILSDNIMRELMLTKNINLFTSLIKCLY
jgi:hypothetical protein